MMRQSLTARASLVALALGAALLPMSSAPAVITDEPGSDPVVKLHHECAGTPTANNGLFRHCGEFPQALPVVFQVNPANAPASVNSSFLNSVTASLATWVTPNNREAFGFNGTTSRVPLKKDVQPGVKADGVNVIGWGDPALCGLPGALACAYSWYSASSGNGRHVIVETDIVLSTSHNWRQASGNDVLLGDVRGTAGLATETWSDLQSTITHELGHALGLNDIGSATAPFWETASDFGKHQQTMYGWSYAGTTNKRSLDVGDIQGLMYVFEKT